MRTTPVEEIEHLRANRALLQQLEAEAKKAEEEVHLEVARVQEFERMEAEKQYMENVNLGAIREKEEELAQRRAKLAKTCEELVTRKKKWKRKPSKWKS